MNELTPKKLNFKPSIANDDEYKSFTANSIFGEYNISFFDNEWHWGFCFEEYYNEGHFTCDSYEDGEEKANAHYKEAINGMDRAIMEECKGE
jgi:hypothetical protein